jgi:hypothetical protein
MGGGMMTPCMSCGRRRVGGTASDNGSDHGQPLRRRRSDAAPQPRCVYGETLTTSVAQCVSQSAPEPGVDGSR